MTWTIPAMLLVVVTGGLLGACGNHLDSGAKGHVAVWGYAVPGGKRSLGGVTVKATAAADKQVTSTRTAKDGSYVLRLPPGHYLLEGDWLSSPSHGPWVRTQGITVLAHTFSTVDINYLEK